MSAPIVSDHAVCRYLERVLGVDTDKIRARILTPDVQMAIDAGANRLPLCDDTSFEVLIREGRVTTIQPRAKAKRKELANGKQRPERGGDAA